MRILALIVAFLSWVLYISAPMSYDYLYCVACFALFLASTFLSVRQDIKENFFFSFTILFSISFFLSSFAYPIFIKELEDVYLFGMQYANENVITKSTALAQLAFSIYTLFYVIIRYKKEKIKIRRQLLSFSRIQRTLDVLLVVALAYFFYEYLFLASNSLDVINFDSGIATTLVLTIIAMHVICFFSLHGYKDMSIAKIFEENRALFVSILMIIVALLYIGDRGIVINIIILLLATYTFYIKRVKLKIIIPISLIGIIFLFLIGNTRGTENSIREKGIAGLFNTQKQTNYWDYFSDLTSISRNLYNGYEYANLNELHFPAKIIPIAFSAIPFFPTLLSELIYDKKYGELSSGEVLTKYSAEQMNLSLSGGLGTHCVSDVYMSWGIGGVFFFFGLFGYLIAYSQKRLQTSIYAAIVYFIFIAYAVYIPRSTMYVCVDIIGKSIIGYFLLHLFTRKRKRIL